MAVTTHVEPSLDIASNVFVEIISFNVVNKGVSVHVTQPKVLAILGLHIVIMEFVHDDLTEIEDGLPKEDGFFHYNTGLSQVAPHQGLGEDDSLFEVWLHHLLEIHLLIHHELDVPMLPDVLHHLPEH